MYDAGFTNQWNIDISHTVISQMKERNQSRQKMVYEVMDVCNMKYEDNFFDFVLDKSTIDTLLCGEHAFQNTSMLIKEVHRVLK